MTPTGQAEQAEQAGAAFRRIHAAGSLNELGPASHLNTELTPSWRRRTDLPSPSRGRSQRSFSPRPVTVEKLLGLLRELFPTGVTKPWPSAGSLYGLDLLALSSVAAPVISTSGGRPYVAAATVEAAGWLDDLLFCQVTGAYWALVLAAHPEPYAQKYGARGYRYALLEAGHLAQELLVLAARHGLATCPIGAFDDRAIAAALAATVGEPVAVYVIAVGHLDD